MPSDEETRRVFIGLRQRGELEAVVGIVTQEIAVQRKKLDKALLSHVLKTPEDWAMFQYQQGRIQACVDLLQTFLDKSTDASARQPAARPDA